jgi:hypothetical protein
MFIKALLESEAVAKCIKVGLLLLLLPFLLYCCTLIYCPLAGDQPFVWHKGNQMGLSDFVNFYNAGAIAASSDRYQIYNPDVQRKWLNRAIKPDRVDGPVYLEYPPWFFTLMAPLSLLPIRTAFVVWSVFWPLLALSTLLLVLGASKITSRLDRMLFIAMVLASAPAVLGIKVGQTSWWFWTMLNLFWWGWRTRSQRLSAAALVLCSIKLQYSLFLLVPVLARKNWRILAWAAGFGCALILITGLDVGWHNLLHYPSLLASIEVSGSHGVSPESMVNLRGLTYQWLPQTVSSLISAAAFVGSLVYLFGLWRRSQSSSQPEPDAWPLATTLVLAVFASLHTHYHDCIILATAAAVTLYSISLRKNSREISLSYKLWSLLLLSYPLSSWLCYAHHHDFAVPILSLVNLVLAAAAVVHTEKSLALSSNEGAAPST